MLVKKWRKCSTRTARTMVPAFAVMTVLTVVFIYESPMDYFLNLPTANTSSAYRGRNTLELWQKTVLSPSAEPYSIILLWTTFFGDTGTWLNLPSSIVCPVSNCRITRDSTVLNESAAVVFHWADVNAFDLPSRYNSNQRWILFTLESPLHSRMDVINILHGAVNWTFTYRVDSDIFIPYGLVLRRKTPGSIPQLPSDRKLACWVVSNCETPSQREKFVEALKVFMPVDVYGNCGNLSCPTTDMLGCYQALSKRYKFYFAFENSICKDYVTEKLFNALRTNMVPVVMGGANYAKILPASSYIDALSFDGPQHLAEYLKTLDNDNDKYMAYLSWKKDYQVMDPAVHWACELCRKLHTKDRMVHNDLLHWWYETAACASWYDLLKNNSFNK